MVDLVLRRQQAAAARAEVLLIERDRLRVLAGKGNRCGRFTTQKRRRPRSSLLVVRRSWTSSRLGARRAAAARLWPPARQLEREHHATNVWIIKERSSGGWPRTRRQPAPPLPQKLGRGGFGSKLASCKTLAFKNLNLPGAQASPASPKTLGRSVCRRLANRSHQ